MKADMKIPNTAIFTWPTGCGKIHLVWDLIEKENNKHFEYIIIICLTLWWNEIYQGLDQAWWQFVAHRTKGQAASLDIKIVTIISTFRNHYHLHVQKHCSSSMISLLMKTFISKCNLYWNCVSQLVNENIYFFYLNSLFSHTNKSDPYLFGTQTKGQAWMRYKMKKMS